MAKTINNFEIHFSQVTFSGVRVDRLHQSFEGETLEDIKPLIEGKVEELKNRFPSGGEVFWKLDKVYAVKSNKAPEVDPEPEGEDEIVIEDFDENILSTLTQTEDLGSEDEKKPKRSTRRKTKPTE